MAQCKVPNCTDEAVSRGLCRGHYSTAFRLVKIRKTSWKKLEATGKVKPVRGSGRGRPLSDAAVWFLGK